MTRAVWRNAPPRAFWAIIAIAYVVFATQALSGIGGVAVTEAFREYLYRALLAAGCVCCLWRAAAVREERAAWLVMGTGIAAWTAGDVSLSVFYADDDVLPIPSIADALFLVFYPAAGVTLVLLLRSRLSGVRPSLWLDGAIGAMATAALASAVLYGPVVRASSDESTLGLLTNLAYPVGDLFLLGLVVAVFGVLGWQPGRAWAVLGVGLALNALGDGIYLYQLTQGNEVPGGLLATMWLASVLLVGVSAWQPVRRHSTPEVQRLRVTLVPVASGILGIALLVYDRAATLDALTLALTALLLLLVVVRTGVLFSENQRMLLQSRAEARTDALTGLRNRRSLMRDLEDQLPAATSAAPVALVLFDLNGFKQYNDSFGHPAGDGLLVRLGHRLDAAVAGGGSAYRLGGDEFCALLRPGEFSVEQLLEDCLDALSERGEGFEVTTSHGLALAPEDTMDPIEALQLADRRMYANKAGGRLSAGSQTRDVLLTSLSERQPALTEHLRTTARLALAVGRALNMSSEELDEVVRAAELHDVGKIAIPEAILTKRGPLDDEEWAFVRQHTIIGERILMSAPALRPVARLVRSSHERWDGNGYPDQLPGDEIPLGARIVAVCSAFDAMTRDQPYRARLDTDAAMAELQRCAGTQFDPVVVAAFARAVIDQTALTSA
jgi:two-component system, cell cycle response regulator